jgi:hypothetical protein
MSYILSIILLLLSLFNNGLAYNCSRCHIEILQNRGLYKYCSGVIKKPCTEYNLQHSRAGIYLCNTIVKESCIYRDEL